MITVIGSLVGFLGSFAPTLLGFWQEKSDRAHELLIMDRQTEAARQGHKFQMEEINIKADASIYKAAHKGDRDTGIYWVEALRGSVRPIITYSFFGLYAVIKIAQFSTAMSVGVDWAAAVAATWTETDMALFSTIICFWFGGRAVSKLLK